VNNKERLKARNELVQLRPLIARAQERNPQIAIVIRFDYQATRTSPMQSEIQTPDQLTYQGARVYAGTSKSDALAGGLVSLNSDGSMSRVSGAIAAAFDRYDEVEFDPINTDSSQLTPPWPAYGLGRFPAGRARLQDVRYDTSSLFDDISERSLNVARVDLGRVEFRILYVPAQFITGITLRTTRQGRDSVDRQSAPLTWLPSANGPGVPVVKLDELIGNVTAAAVFPANQFTAELFEPTPATEGLKFINPRPRNGEHVRWVRPENIDLSEHG
jgi:hypothetical protein